MNADEPPKPSPTPPVPISVPIPPQPHAATPETPSSPPPASPAAPAHATPHLSVVHGHAPALDTPLLPLPPATGSEKAAWILMGLGLLMIIHFHLVSGLLAGLFVYALIRGVAQQIRGKWLDHEHAKVAALALVGGVLIIATVILVLLTITFIKGRIGHIPELLDRMSLALDKGRIWIRDLGLGDMAPGVETEQLPDFLKTKLHEHKEELQHVGGEAGHVMLHALIGIVVGALVSFEYQPPKGPFGIALAGRIRRLADAFNAVVFAQIKISALNTILTAIYLLAVMPALGFHIEGHIRYTLIALTFLFGLLPVVGNLISNAIIVLISLGVAPAAAAASLIFLVVIHKLEYFVNAKIMGSQIHAAAWEMLLVIFTFEAIFGIPGVIMAPIVYAYVKGELIGRRLI